MRLGFTCYTAMFQAERRRKFLEECLNDRYAGELAAKRENKRKFRIKTILGHASHWFLGRAMNNWCQYVIIRREEKRRMKSIIFAMTHGKLRSAINKWKRTIRELDKLEEISDELWGKGRCVLCLCLNRICSVLTPVHEYDATIRRPTAGLWYGSTCCAAIWKAISNLCSAK